MKQECIFFAAWLTTFLTLPIKADLIEKNSILVEWERFQCGHSITLVICVIKTERSMCLELSTGELCHLK